MQGLSIGAVALLIAAPQILLAQTQGPPGSVQLVEYDDGMVSWVYAFVRAEAEPVMAIEGKGIMFARDPVLLFACMGGEVVVVYRFDIELMVDDENAVWIQHRFGEQRASERQAWPQVIDRRTTSELAAAAMIIDSAFVQMVSGLATAARMPAEYTAGFLEGAGAAAQVTVRVTDPVDGATYTDLFPLLGFGEAIGQVTQRCTVKQ